MTPSNPFIENFGEKEVSNKRYEIRILAPEMEITKETSWSRITGQNSAYKEFLEIVGNGSPTGSVPEETIAVSVTISISVQKRHSRIRLQILSCNRMREMRNLHQFILWQPSECLFSRPRVVADLEEKCSNAHRQIDEQPTKRSKKIDD